MRGGDLIYAGKTDKTIQRDLNWLAEQGYITRAGEVVKANFAVLTAFLPRHADRRG